MALHQNVLKLRDSKIPDYTHSTTLVREGYAGLSEGVLDKEYIVNGIFRNYYLQHEAHDGRSAQHAVLIAALLAKEIKLSGAQVIFVTLAGFIREVQFNAMDREVERINPVMKYIGKGYIVMPDFGEFENPAEVYSQRELHAVADYLTTHVGDGGGLVLAGRPATSNSVTAFGATLSRLLEDRFDIHAVTVS